MSTTLLEPDIQYIVSECRAAVKAGLDITITIPPSRVQADVLACRLVEELAVDCPGGIVYLAAEPFPFAIELPSERMSAMVLVSPVIEGAGRRSKVWETSPAARQLSELVITFIKIGFHHVIPGTEPGERVSVVTSTVEGD